MEKDIKTVSKLLFPDKEEVDENFLLIADYIKDHVISVGKEQAVKDFQTL